MPGWCIKGIAIKRTSPKETMQRLDFEMKIIDSLLCEKR